MPCNEALRLRTELDKVIDARLTVNQDPDKPELPGVRRRELRVQADSLLAEALSHQQDCDLCQPV